MLLVLTLAAATVVVQTAVFVRLTAQDPQNVLRLLYRHGFFTEIQSLLDQTLATAAQFMGPEDISAARAALLALMSPQHIAQLASGLPLSSLKRAALDQFEAAGASPEAVLAAASWLAEAPDHIEIPLPFPLDGGLGALLRYAPALALGASAVAAALLIALTGPARGIRLTLVSMALGGVCLFLAATWLRSGLETGRLQPFGEIGLPLAVDPRLTSNLQGVLTAVLHDLVGRLRLMALGPAAAGALLAAFGGRRTAARDKPL